MKQPILPKLQIINSKNNISKPIILKKENCIPTRLKKSKSYKLTSTTSKKVNNSIILNISLKTFKIIGLKNLLNEPKKSVIINNKTKSIKQDFFSNIKEKQSSLIGKNEIIPIDSYNKEKNNMKIETYKFFTKTFRNYCSNKKINSFKNNSSNINPKNSTLYFKSKNSTTYRSIDRQNILSSSISKIKSYKKKKKKIENNLHEISIKTKFKYEDIFIKFIIERFIDNHYILKDKKEKNLKLNELNNSNKFYKRLNYKKNLSSKNKKKTY